MTAVPVAATPRRRFRVRSGRGTVRPMDRPFAVTELDHVVLRCRDPERMLAFYRDVLGLPEERRIEAIGLVQLRAGRSLVDLLRDWEPEGRGTPNVDHVCLGVAPTAIEPIVAWLQAHDVEVVGEPMVRYGARGNGPSVYLRDPEGNVVELKPEPADA
jgi:catechol 2,3-dioxygenase-like lactoylglutathione lyase family enzyme